MTTQKRALAVQDLSCVGKCSLTVALPVLSAAGVETSVLPTALLSTHTGGFGTPAVHDLTPQLTPFLDHWQSFGYAPDAILTGYLGTAAQVELVHSLFDRLGGNALKVVDPAMGDGGKLYSGFDPTFPSVMAGLCERADVMVPNLTEAALLLGRPFSAPSTRKDVSDLLTALGERFPGHIVLTGVSLTPGTVGAAALHRTEGISFSAAPLMPGRFHGAGDLFSAALVAALLAGRDLRDAAAVASHFTTHSIQHTDPHGDERYGIRFEAALPDLMWSLDLL